MAEAVLVFFDLADLDFFELCFEFFDLVGLDFFVFGVFLQDLPCCGIPMKGARSARFPFGDSRSIWT